MSNSIQVRSAKIVKGPPSTDCELVVLGAGPYGLSAGAYLKAKEIDVRVFGEPMDCWANQMPKGMLLRSPREASNIADPGSAFTQPMKRRPKRVSNILS
jgi:cation diffusion facilitator CzcD-associated flavoprotein CzcO